MGKNKNTVVATGIGIAVGAVLGILFAPAKGSETREQIAQKAVDVKDGALQKKDELVDALSSKKEEVAEYLLGLKESLSDTISDVKDDKKKALLTKIQDLENLIKKG